MTPGARVQASIDILDLIVAAARDNGPPADKIIAEWFRTRRFAGSGDRRAVRELVYRAIRVCGELPENGRAALVLLAREDAALAGLFDGQGHSPAPIAEGEPVAKPGVAPRWLSDLLLRSDLRADEQAAMLGRAPLDLRVNRLLADRDALLPELPVLGEPFGADGIRLPFGTAVEGWDAYQDGRIEIQDAGSQAACAALAVQPGETVIDLCAGAGGKTLALAAAMANRGRIIAADIDRGRLSRLAPRARRAGAGLIEERLLNPGGELEMLGDLAGKADAVLIDAPCSGTGTWRRSPEARWRLTPKQLERYRVTQANLLAIGAALVRPGGRLGFITCSVLDSEGADQVEAFLASQPEWSALPLSTPPGRARGNGVRLTPLHDLTDGFFYASLQRL